MRTEQLISAHRGAPENQMEEIAGVEAILHLLDGCELPATTWEPAVLAARVKNYDQPDRGDRRIAGGKSIYINRNMEFNPKKTLADSPTARCMPFRLLTGLVEAVLA
jgi:hypothetical protein